MIFDIYDYKGKATKADTHNKEVRQLLVQVLSGDEVVTVDYGDGTNETYDSSNNRFINRFDGSYSVTLEDLQEWIAYGVSRANSNSENLSYKRMYEFD